MVEAGRGLAAAHASGVLHRDFKPDNVLVDAAGRVCVGDFGLATLGEGAYTPITSTAIDASPSTELTTTGALIGTPAYMSPQQLRGEPIDARADQFSFCVAAWEALYGARPFTVASTSLDAIPMLIDRIEAGEVGAPPEGSTVPAAVREVLLRGLAKEPAARWPDLEALLATLVRAGGRLPTAARPATQLPTPSPARARLAITVAAVAAAVAAIAVIVAITRPGRDGRRPGAPSAAAAGAPAAAVAPVPQPMFGVSLRSVIALSPDGRRIAVGSDRLEVRELDGSRTWATGTGGKYVTAVEFEGDELRFSYLSEYAIWRWRYLDGGEPTLEVASVGGRWLGRTAFGELVFKVTEGYRFEIDGHATWPTPTFIDLVEISPDRRRVAYVVPGRFEGRLIIRDLERGTELASELIPELTAITWLDDATLALATGSSEQPRIVRRALERARLADAVELHRAERGWFGQLRGRDRTLFVTELRPTARARLLERSDTVSSISDLDTTQVGAALGWTSPTAFLTWNPETGRIDRRTRETLELTDLTLDREPANATLADELLIVALRGARGREVRAVSRATGHVAWRHGDRRTLAVRCAGDLRPPCFAIRTEAGRDRVVRVDPRTGELGTQVVFERPPAEAAAIEDLAVSDDGSRMLIVGGGKLIHEIATTGEAVRQLPVPLSAIRSVAYDPRGGVLIAGTLSRNRYQVGRLRDGAFELLTQSNNDLLSFVRPSASGDRVLILARLYTPSLWRLELPAPP